MRRGQQCPRRFFLLTEPAVPTPKRDNSVHVRLSCEADALLELIGEAQRKDKAALAADLLERALLGEAHSLKVAAMRFARLGTSGIDGEGRG